MQAVLPVRTLRTSLQTLALALGSCASSCAGDVGTETESDPAVLATPSASGTVDASPMSGPPSTTGTGPGTGMVSETNGEGSATATPPANPQPATTVPPRPTVEEMTNGGASGAAGGPTFPPFPVGGAGGETGGGVPDGSDSGGSASGGRPPFGGPAFGGGSSSGGSSSGGSSSGGSSSGGSSSGGMSGGPATGGAAGSATGGGGGSGAVEIDCDAQMPTSGGEQHSATWAQGGEGNLAWQIWTNGGPGNLTTYEGIPAFTASWNNSGDYLGRLGFEWGNNGKKYTEYGTIRADYVWNKSGTAGQYSYIGLYGWTNNPCIEWYIVEDSFHQMPFNTGDRPVGTTDIDGGTYNLVYRHTTGTGGDRCGGAGSWDQFYSIRLEGKRCGTITVSDHFDAWAAQGWNLGNLIEVKIVVEAAAGTGSVDFPLANVTTTQ